MKIVCSPLTRLTTEQLAAWARLQESDPQFGSPYFRPEFAQAVAAHRGEVEVAVFEDGGDPVGFWPFQRTKKDVATALGGGLSDFQGVICRKGLSWHAEEMLRACGLTAWDFDHLLVSQQPFHPYHLKTSPSPYMNLAGGFECYRASIRAQTLSHILRQGRMLEREIGELRLEAHSNDMAVFDALVAWKREKHGLTDSDADFLKHILGKQSVPFAGALTALYAGDELAAVHFGMRSQHVLHAWFPAYNPSLQKYSPGLVMWIELAKRAQALGIERIDLGRDRGKTGQYKSRLMSGETYVAEGFVAGQPLARWRRLSQYAAREWMQTTRLRKPARWLRNTAVGVLGHARRAS